MKEKHIEKSKPFIILSDIVYSVALRMIIVILLVTLSVFILPVTYGTQVFADDDMVSFTVYYQDKDGKALNEAKIFYGKAGDKPSVYCDAIDGYEPVITVLTKTLTKNEKDNVFTFVYHENASKDAAPSDKKGQSDGKDTVIEDSNTPLADVSSSKHDGSSFGSGEADGSPLDKSSSLSDQAGASLDDDKVLDLDKEDPLAAPGEAQKSFDYVLILVIALQILVLAAVVMAIRKRRKIK